MANLESLRVLLVRLCSKFAIEQTVDTILSCGTATVEELFVLLFQTRSIRHGLGERDAAAALWRALILDSRTKAIALDLLDLVPIYGRWKDLIQIAYECPNTMQRVLSIIEAQIQKDELAMCDGSGTLSLLAKWMPREGHRMAVECACRLFPGPMFLPTRMKLYRKRIANLNKALNTLEIKMCSGAWDTIVPAKVPALALKKYHNAFLKHAGSHEKFAEYFSKQGTGDPYQLVRERVRAASRD